MARRLDPETERQVAADAILGRRPVNDAGERITRSNSRTGSVERQRLYKYESERRLQHGRRLGKSPAQALGHPLKGDTSASISAILTDASGAARSATVTGTGRDIARTARYNALVGQLASGRITPGEFERRVKSWKPLSTGDRFSHDAAAVIAVTAERAALGYLPVEYSSGRAS